MPANMQNGKVGKALKKPYSLNQGDSATEGGWAATQGAAQGCLTFSSNQDALDDIAC